MARSKKWCSASEFCSPQPAPKSGRAIIGIADIENKASIRVLEKVGFQFEKVTTYRGHEVAWYAIGR